MTDDNRFAPPGSPVGDVPPPSSAKPPERVVLAVRLLWISLIVGLPTLFMQGGEHMSGSERAAGFVFQVGLFVFAAYLNLCIARRRNWARIVSLVFFLLGLVLLAAMPQSATVTVLEKVINIVDLLLDGAAMYLLFSPPGSTWFATKPR